MLKLVQCRNLEIMRSAFLLRTLKCPLQNMESASRFKFQNAYQGPCVVIYLACADSAVLHASDSAPKTGETRIMLLLLSLSPCPHALEVTARATSSACLSEFLFLTNNSVVNVVLLHYWSGFC